MAAPCDGADLAGEGTTPALEAPEAGTTCAASVRVERVLKGTLSEGTLELRTVEVVPALAKWVRTEDDL